MKRVLTLYFICLCFSTGIFAQTLLTIDFENFGLGLDTFLNGSTVNGSFETSNVIFPNNYEDFGAFEAWYGWSISTKQDSVTAGFSNQYSSMTGSGYNSDAYAVSYINIFSQPTVKNVIKFDDLSATEWTPKGFYINNSAYTYYSMLNGDLFAKQFGGATGDDPDFLLLTIKKYKNGTLSTDSVDFYLADYRFSDNSQDYIVKDWTWVDLSSLGLADSLYFTMQSTDVDPTLGINTPLYFCMDDFEVENIVASTTNLNIEPLNIFPNPTVDVVNISGMEIEQNADILRVIDINGRVIVEHQMEKYIQQYNLDVSNWASGIYTIQIGQQNAKLIKK